MLLRSVIKLSRHIPLYIALLVEVFSVLLYPYIKLLLPVVCFFFAEAATAADHMPLALQDPSVDWVTTAFCMQMLLHHSLNSLVILQAIDLEPEEPVMRTNHKHDRRRHITRVLLLVLQVVNSEVATKQQSPNTMSQAVAFVAQHSRMMQRVLREAAVGNLNGWEPGEREAELATLVLSLVTRLSFNQLSQQPGAPAGLFHCVDTQG